MQHCIIFENLIIVGSLAHIVSLVSLWFVKPTLKMALKHLLGICATWMRAFSQGVAVCSAPGKGFDLDYMGVKLFGANVRVGVAYFGNSGMSGIFI